MREGAYFATYHAFFTLGQVPKQVSNVLACASLFLVLTIENFLGAHGGVRLSDACNFNEKRSVIGCS